MGLGLINAHAHAQTQVAPVKNKYSSGVRPGAILEFQHGRPGTSQGE